MIQKVKIRKAKLSDLAKIYKLFKQLADLSISLDDEDIWFKEKEIIKQKVKEQKIIVATNKQQIVGHLAFEEYSKSIEIDTLIVDGKYRKRGIGTMLVNDFMDKIKGINLPLRVGTYKCYDCKDFYLKLGFKLIPQHELANTWEFIK